MLFISDIVISRLITFLKTLNPIAIEKYGMLFCLFLFFIYFYTYQLEMCKFGFWHHNTIIHKTNK